MRHEDGNSLRWQRQFDMHLDDTVKAQFAIGLHERSAQTEIFHAAVKSSQGGCRHMHGYIYANPLSPAVFHSVAQTFHDNSVRILEMAPEPWEGGAQTRPAPAQARNSASQFAKPPMGGKGAVNHSPGNAPQQAVTDFRGQVLQQHWCKHPLFGWSDYAPW
jgi:hypothetical protein